MDYKEFNEHIEKLRKTHTVISADYDDAPNEVADGFVSFLRKEGYQVDELYHDDIPSVYYRIEKINA